MLLDLPKDPEFDAGVWYSTPASSFYPVHHHHELELKIVLWGRAVVAVGSERIELQPGSQLWLVPGQEHVLAELSDDFTMWVASFRERAVAVAEKQTGARVLARGPSWGACMLSASELRALSSLCARHVLYEHPEELNCLSERVLVRALGAWRSSALVGAAASNARSAPLHPAVAHARSLLRGSEGDLPLEVLSHRCCLSPARLSRLFKAQMGLSIVQFRNHYRVQQFIARFGHGEARTMLEVALDSGFGSYPQFYRAFRQVTGYPPTEHLRRVRAGIVAPLHQSLQTRMSAAGR